MKDIRGLVIPPLRRHFQCHYPSSSNKICLVQQEQEDILKMCFKWRVSNLWSSYGASCQQQPPKDANREAVKSTRPLCGINRESQRRKKAERRGRGGLIVGHLAHSSRRLSDKFRHQWLPPRNICFIFLQTGVRQNFWVTVCSTTTRRNWPVAGPHPKALIVQSDGLATAAI